LNWALGFELLGYYAWSDVSLFGVRQDKQGNWSILTEAAVAYDQVREWLVSRTMTSCGLDATGLWRADFVATQPNGGTLRSAVLWSALDAVAFEVPAGAIRLRTMDGSAEELDGGSVRFVDRNPVLVEWTCADDITADGQVDAADLGALLGAWGATGAGIDADLNADGIVNAEDLAALLGAWGLCS
jgi:hypothetical protein